MTDPMEKRNIVDSDFTPEFDKQASEDAFEVEAVGSFDGPNMGGDAPPTADEVVKIAYAEDAVMEKVPQKTRQEQRESRNNV